MWLAQFVSPSYSHEIQEKPSYSYAHHCNASMWSLFLGQIDLFVYFLKNRFTSQLLESNIFPCMLCCLLSCIHLITC